MENVAVRDIEAFSGSSWTLECMADMGVIAMGTKILAGSLGTLDLLEICQLHNGNQVL